MNTPILTKNRVLARQVPTNLNQSGLSQTGQRIIAELYQRLYDLRDAVSSYLVGGNLVAVDNLGNLVDGGPRPIIIRSFQCNLSPAADTVYFPASAFAGTITAWKIVSPMGSVATVKFWKIKAGTHIPTVADVINTLGVSITVDTAISSIELKDFKTLTIFEGDLLAAHLTVGTDPITVRLEYQ